LGGYSVRRTGTWMQQVAFVVATVALLALFLRVEPARLTGAQRSSRT
jgi:hypothetical protein